MSSTKLAGVGIPSTGLVLPDGSGLGGFQILPILALTAGTTPAVAGLLGNAGALVMPNNTSWFYEAFLVGRGKAAGQHGAWIQRGIISRGANAAATAIIYNPAVVAYGGVGNQPPSGWSIACTADTTAGGLLITVTAAAGTDVRWSGRVHLQAATHS